MNIYRSASGKVPHAGLEGIIPSTIAFAVDCRCFTDTGAETKEFDVKRSQKGTKHNENGGKGTKVSQIEPRGCQSGRPRRTRIIIRTPSGKVSEKLVRWGAEISTNRFSLIWGSKGSPRVAKGARGFLRDSCEVSGYGTTETRCRGASRFVEGDSKI